MKNSKDRIRSVIKSYLEEREEIKFAYLFGSFLTNDQYHDIDIAVYAGTSFLESKNKFPFGYESFIISNLTKLLKTDKIDLVLLNKSTLLLSVRIINRGELLFEKDRFMRIEFENSIRKKFIDTENLRKIKTQYIRRNIKNA